MLSQRRIAILISTFVGACGGLPIIDEPPHPDPFAAVLAAVADSSRFTATMRVDPRTFDPEAEAFDSTAVQPVAPDQLLRRERSIREHGYSLGDAFLSIECGSGGRLLLIQGQDTLIRPSRPPLDAAMRERCRAYKALDPGRPHVLIQSTPERSNEGWLTWVYIVGDGVSENWEISLSDAMHVTRVRLMFASRS